RAPRRQPRAGRFDRVARDPHRPAVRERTHLVGIGRLEPADAERAIGGRPVRATLARTGDPDPRAGQRVATQLGAHASTCPASRSVSWRACTSTTAESRRAACAAACPAAWPSSISVGSIRTDPNATCDADRHTGTRRFVASARDGVSDRYGMPYGGTATDR